MNLIDFFTDYWWIILIGLLPSLIAWSYRHQRSYHKFLAEELAKYGCEYLSETIPHVGDMGPFQREWVQYNSHLRLFGISGRWTTYRIVTYLDKNKVERQSWVRLRYNAFQRMSVAWKPRPGNALVPTKRKNRRR